jgi:hypothetical protein
MAMRGATSATIHQPEPVNRTLCRIAHPDATAVAPEIYALQIRSEESHRATVRTCWINANCNGVRVSYFNQARLDAIASRL